MWFAHPANVSLPGTDEAARTHLAIPIRAAITREQVREVVERSGRMLVNLTNRPTRAHPVTGRRATSAREGGA